MLLLFAMTFNKICFCKQFRKATVSGNIWRFDDAVDSCSLFFLLDPSFPPPSRLAVLRSDSDRRFYIKALAMEAQEGECKYRYIYSLFFVSGR